MEKYVVLQDPSLDGLNEQINKLSDKYAPVGNLIFADGKFVQQVCLTEEGERLSREEESRGYSVVSDEQSFRKAIESGKSEIFFENDIVLSGSEKVVLSRPVTINLKGHSLSSTASVEVLRLEGGKVFIKNGKISSNVYKWVIIYKSGWMEMQDVEVEGTYAIAGATGSNAEIRLIRCKLNGSKYAAAPVGGKFYASNTEFVSGSEAAFAGNGSADRPAVDGYFENCIFRAPERAAAVYWPTDDVVTFVKCDLEGGCAAYIKSGVVNFKGCSLKATAPKRPYESKGEGYEPTGDVVICDACGYPKGDAEVSIVSSSFERLEESCYDIAEYIKEGHESSQEIRMSPVLKAKVNF